MKPDYSAWLTPERLEVEELAWATCQYYRDFADAVMSTAARFGIASVVEFGCGTGWVPSLLPSYLTYTGIDANPGVIERAAVRNPQRVFQLGDIRTAVPPAAGLGCSFSVLKHFGLDEWDAIVARVLYTDYGLFTMPVGLHTVDDGVEFPHVWVTEMRLRAAVKAAGHEIVELTPQRSGETLVLTTQW